MIAAANLIQTVQMIQTREISNLRSTIIMFGKIAAGTKSNIIPDKVHFTVDIRSWDDDHAIKAWEDVRVDFETIAQRRGCPIKIEETWRVEHSPFDEKLVQRVLNTAENLGYSNLHMVSGAGHDSVYVSRVAPTGMIFIPCRDGLSHNEAEYATPEDIGAGCNVLLNAVLSLDAG